MTNTLIVSVDKVIDKVKERNFFFTVLALNFVWMLFHFTVVFFFTLQLESIALVWIFLGLWNLFAFFFDIPIWVLQNYIKSKTLFIVACLSQLIAMLIFANFIRSVTNFIAESLTTDVWIIDSVLSFFLKDGLNLFLLLIASICYWLTKELQEVTIISYILNNSSPNDYPRLFSRKNLAMWIGAFLWLFFSWIILTFSPKLIIFSLIFLILLILFFTKKYFDNSDTTINFKDITKFKVFLNKGNISNLKDNLRSNITKIVNKIELKNIINNTRYVFIKPFSLKKWLNFDLLLAETKKNFSLMYKLIFKENTNLILYWAISIFLVFWFWDTFAVTFLVWYLEELKHWWSYILLWIIAIPAFLFQGIFSNLALKFWDYKIAILWLILSSFSLIFMWFFSWNSFFIIIALAVINSIWYASCIILSQSIFMVKYNQIYSESLGLKEIDANAASAPIKILQNLANVIWLFFWWMILWFLEYDWFFVVFWLFIFTILIASIILKQKLKD